MDTFSNFTIATYNIQFGINTQKIVQNIKKMAEDGAQIFCLEEIINTPDKEFILDIILKKLGHNWKTIYHVGEEASRLSIGTAILWDTTILELTHEEKILLPKLKKFDLHEKLYYRIVGIPGIPLQRRVTVGNFIYKHIPIRITCVHIDNVGGPRHRIKQITYLLAKLNKKGKAQHEIISGDFNTFDLLKTGYEKKLLQKKFGKDFIDASAYVGWTSDIYNIDFQTSIKFFPWFIKAFNIHIRRRLDYIWVKNLKIITCKKITVPGSDHFPIFAKIKI